jgi:hypothetical protein
MTRRQTLYGLPIAVAAMLTFALARAWAADQEFLGQLDPVAFDNSTRANVVGIGNISAVLVGSTLIVSGRFSELASPAVAAQLRMGLAMGVPGPVIGKLTVAHAISGEIAGKVKLSAAQIAALHENAVYVQLDSVKAPDGNLWGWLEAVQ